MTISNLLLKPRYKWFSAPDRYCDNGWYGPHKTIEEAIIDCASEYGFDDPIFVAQGYKMTKAEREEWGAEFDWEVDTKNTIEIILK